MTAWWAFDSCGGKGCNGFLASKNNIGCDDS